MVAVVVVVVEVVVVVFSFSFSFSSRWHCQAQKGPRNSANICLVEHKSFLTLEVGILATSFLHSSFLQAINAVMLRKFLKSLSTSALPSCRPDVISAVLASFLLVCSHWLRRAQNRRSTEVWGLEMSVEVIVNRSSSSSSISVDVFVIKCYDKCCQRRSTAFWRTERERMV